MRIILVVSDLAGRLRAASEADMADNQVPPPDGILNQNPELTNC
jgi:hypothetical protein